jgi:CheY-like chemotaxis protein
VLCDQLERIGLKSEIAGNGREGLDMVLKRVNEGRKPYDLIFMDIQMPVMDGIEAAFLIDKLRTGTPIVALTANIMAHDRELYLKNGMTECLGKPFLSQDLWRCLLKHLKPVNWKTESEAQSKMFDENLMGRLTVNFVNAHQGTYRAITAALDAGDIKTAHRLAHTLKGHSGLLGRTGLQKAAGQVESLIADGRNLVTPEALSALETELNAALAELAGLLEQAGSPEAPPEAEPLGPEKARELLAELKPLLERGNPECLKLIDSLRGLSGSEKLIRQMEDLDFKRAAETLREWDSEYFMSD